MNCPYTIGGTRSSGPFSEGRACHVRRLILDHPSPFPGHDKRAPPTYFGGTFSEGPACQVRFRRDVPVTSVIQRWMIHCLRRGLKSRAESGAKAPHSIWSAAIHRRFWVKALAFTTSAIALFSRAPDKCPLVGAIHELPLHYRRDPLVGSVEFIRLMHPSPFPGHDKRAPPKPLFRRDLLVRSVFRRDVPVTSVIQRWMIHCLRRGLKSRAESGAKAPHSIWSAAIYRRFW
ncbi:MAG: hypothetical protein KatS3mg112_0791 [Thermogutta sp.]|nr:MAG: hypothetical protein KatS3mg112_0791 [Thermogutta sp.]